MCPMYACSPQSFTAAAVASLVAASGSALLVAAAFKRQFWLLCLGAIIQVTLGQPHRL